MIAPLSDAMARALRGAIQMADDWRVLRDGTNGRVLRALKDRDLVAWSIDGYLLTARGRQMRNALLDHDAAEELFLQERRS